jgi:uncharacterized protein (DUF934 family)
MRVIKDRKVIEDNWLVLAVGATVPDEADVLVSLERWNGEHAALNRRAGKTGGVLRSDESPLDIAELQSVPLVAIDFPKFSDGRGYSSARILRERLQYQGELRAIGNVLRDQLFYMLRCGIDSFALQEGKDVQGALEAFDEFTVMYQAAADERQPIYRRVPRGV